MSNLRKGRIALSDLRVKGPMNKSNTVGSPLMLPELYYFRSGANTSFIVDNDIPKSNMTSRITL